MLFLGNSYTFVNELDQVTASVFEAAGTPLAESTRLAEAGWTLAMHRAQVETDGTDWSVAFAEPHDWVVLQEQSQIPGFPDTEPTVIESRAAAVALDGYAAQTGAQTVFLMTWGRRDGDVDNPEIYPDYPTMQAHLTEGYLAYVDLAGADGTPAWVAPAGLAWQKVYDDVVAAGNDPADPTSAFYNLYIDDGSHPSPRGTYLAACVVYATVTGLSPEGLDAPDAVPDAAYLQSVAAEVVLHGEGIAYPWQDAGNDTGTGGDTGTVDSGGGDSGGADTAAPDSGDPSGGPGDDPPTTGEPADAGCGCDTGTGGQGWAGLAALAALVLRLRARS